MKKIKFCLSTWKRSLNNSRRKLLGCTTKSPCKVNLSQTKSRKILKVQTKESETTVRRKLWEGEPPFAFWLLAPKLATRRFDASGSYSTPSRSSSTFLSFCLILENIELTWQGADFFSMFRRMFHRFFWNISNFTNFLKSITNQLSSLTFLEKFKTFSRTFYNYWWRKCATESFCDSHTERRRRSSRRCKQSKSGRWKKPNCRILYLEE